MQQGGNLLRGLMVSLQVAIGGYCLGLLIGVFGLRQQARNYLVVENERAG